MSRTGITHLVALSPGEPYPVLAHAPTVPPLASSVWHRQAPDWHAILEEDGCVIARCSCWWTSIPPSGGVRAGVIGHFAARDAEAASRLLRHACGRLAAAGCRRAVGPMDGNTWRPYRFVTDRGHEPPFFLEPWHVDWLPQWSAAGFEPIATYTSAATVDLAIEDPRVARACARLAREDVRIRPLNVSDPERDLRRIFGLSMASFSRSFLFSPISEAEFLEQSRPLLPVIRPELVLLAERQGHLCGYLFAVPDHLEARRSTETTTIVIKTVAVAPESAVRGLGSVLVARAHRIARECGYGRAIHALMHDANVSRNISFRYARPIRRYALLGRAL